MRIRRPGIEELNPFIDRSDPFSLSYGNSHLDVEKTNNRNQKSKKVSFGCGSTIIINVQ
ncbi:MAG: outer membrane beta-barrel family protein [Salinivirgaceae bacterium]|nr:outer membrane beta-barrel family protein [Salinivirgaceae bacterium]